MITLLNNISEVLTLESAFKKDGRNLLPEDSCIIDNAAVIHNQEEIQASRRST